MKEKILKYTTKCTCKPEYDIDKLPELYVKFLFNRVVVGITKPKNEHICRGELYYDVWNFERKLGKLVNQIINEELEYDTNR